MLDESDPRLSDAVMKIRSGQYPQGLAIMDQMIKEDEDFYVAYAWRGAGRALSGNLLGAYEDFTKALEGTAASPEVWKQRAQVQVALGRHMEAVADWDQALQLEPSDLSARLERAVSLVNANAYKDALPDLFTVRSMKPNLGRVHLFLGLAQTASGDPWSAVSSYERAMEIDPSIKEAWTNFGQTMKELADLPRSEWCYKQALKVDPNWLLPYKLWSKLRHGAGDHRTVLRIMDKALERHPYNVELRYFQASCFHALGNFSAAIPIYDSILALQPEGEETNLQFLAFYQREVAAYTAFKVDRPLTDFNMEDFDANFKEHWGRTQNPGHLMPLGYKFQPLHDAMAAKQRVSFHSLATKHSDYIDRLRRLLNASDEIGKLIQYNCTGFMHNQRQQRMAGLTALNIMLVARKTWKAMADERRIKLDGMGFGSDDEGEEGSKDGGEEEEEEEDFWSSRLNFFGGRGGRRGEDDGGAAIPVTKKWRELYSVAVRWRQLVEPCDPILWIDQLTSIAFQSGFGSVTPMISGQTRNIRYSMNAPRAMDVMKRELLKTGTAYGEMDQRLDLNPDLQPKVEDAKDLADLFRLFNRTFFIVTPCESTAIPGKILNGTRLVITPFTPGHEFAIRTPLTPSRWRDYDIEMAAAWKEVCEAVLDVKGRRSDPDANRIRVWNGILRMAYYWYNFMPLSRGSAMTGYVTMLGLFAAHGYKLTTTIPRGMQTDWEAILTKDVETFTGRLSAWMYPALKKAPELRRLPKVTKMFPTVGTVFEALSTYED